MSDVTRMVVSLLAVTLGTPSSAWPIAHVQDRTPAVSSLQSAQLQIEDQEPGASSASSPQADDRELTSLSIEPPRVEAGMFFDGATVTVSADVPGDVPVAMACIGGDGSVALNRKGKVLGLIWMNVGEVEFRDTPGLYLLNTSTELDRLAPPGTLTALGVGYEALEARASAEPEPRDRGSLFRELVRLRESEGLYSVSEGTVERSLSAGGMTHVSTQFHLPAKAPQGEYSVLVYGFPMGEGAIMAKGTLELQQVGAAAFISKLATEQGLLYGILAVAVAVVVGLLTGMVFGLGSKKAH